MLIQSTTTITSNSYFVKLFPFYLLNLLPAMAADMVILKYSRKENEGEKMTECSSYHLHLLAQNQIIWLLTH